MFDIGYSSLKLIAIGGTPGKDTGRMPVLLPRGRDHSHSAWHAPGKDTGRMPVLLKRQS